MNPFDAVLGHTNVISRLIEACDAGRLAPAFIFEGPSGVGKSLVARALAHRSNRESFRDASSAEMTWQRIEKGVHPDIRSLSPRQQGAGNIPVDMIRQEIRQWAQSAPFESQHAWLIIQDADIALPRAHAESSNALLKLIEEPKQNVHFVLCAERSENLLPTLRSRCQHTRFTSLDDSHIHAIAARHAANDRAATDLLRRVVIWARGRADVALRLLAHAHTQTMFDLAHRWIAQQITWSSAPTATAAEDLINTIEALTQLDNDRHENRWLLIQVLDLCEVIYRDMAARDLACDETMLRLKTATAELSLEAAQCAEYVHRIEHAKTLLHTSAQPQLTLEHMVFA